MLCGQSNYLQKQTSAKYLHMYICDSNIFKKIFYMHVYCSYLDIHMTHPWHTYTSFMAPQEVNRTSHVTASFPLDTVPLQNGPARVRYSRSEFAIPYSRLKVDALRLMWRPSTPQFRIPNVSSRGIKGNSQKTFTDSRISM